MRVYFAGPLFTTPERTWNAEVAAALRSAGHEVFLPQEKEPGKDAAGIFEADVGGIDRADALVAIMDGPDPDSGTSWEVGYAYGLKKPIVLVRTDLRVLAGETGEYNSMLTQAATIRLDMPAASSAEVVSALVEALERVEAGSRGRMARTRIDNVGIVVEDLDAAIAFFEELGLELEGRATVEGELVDRLVDLQGIRSDIAMMRTADGHGRLELSRYERPPAVGPDPRSEPANTRGMGRVMFNVDDIDDVVARLRTLGGELVGEIVQYEDSYRLCYLRGPEGIIVALAQELG